MILGLCLRDHCVSVSDDLNEFHNLVHDYGEIDLQRFLHNRLLELVAYIFRYKNADDARLIWKERNRTVFFQNELIFFKIDVSFLHTTIVKNLPNTMNNRKLFLLFDSFGTVNQTQLITDMPDESNHLYGFIHHVDKEESKNFRSMAHNQNYHNQKLTAHTFQIDDLKTNEEIEEIEARKIYIENFHTYFTESTFPLFFAKYGKVDRYVAVMDSDNPSNNFGYVIFSTEKEALEAYEKLNDYELEMKIPISSSGMVRIRYETRKFKLKIYMSSKVIGNVVQRVLEDITDDYKVIHEKMIVEPSKIEEIQKKVIGNELKSSEENNDKKERSSSKMKLRIKIEKKQTGDKLMRFLNHLENFGKIHYIQVDQNGTIAVQYTDNENSLACLEELYENGWKEFISISLNNSNEDESTKKNSPLQTSNTKPIENKLTVPNDTITSIENRNNNSQVNVKSLVNSNVSTTNTTIVPTQVSTSTSVEMPQNHEHTSLTVPKLEKSLKELIENNINDGLSQFFQLLTKTGNGIEIPAICQKMLTEKELRMVSSQRNSQESLDQLNMGERIMLDQIRNKYPYVPSTLAIRLSRIILKKAPQVRSVILDNPHLFNLLLQQAHREKRLFC
ncbi:hypothetical protein SNEBB_009166 [Seison nebaliae]|nr:hypothetical protein SNEBB_009166 [Seison nebaliae]